MALRKQSPLTVVEDGEKERLSYRGVPKSGEGFAKSSNGSIMASREAAEAYRTFRKQLGWTHTADEHEVKAFVGGFDVGVALRVEVMKPGVSDRDARRAEEERQRAWDEATKVGRQQAYSALRKMLEGAGIEVGKDNELQAIRDLLDRTAEVDPLASILAAAEVLQGRIEAAEGVKRQAEEERDALREQAAVAEGDRRDAARFRQMQELMAR